MGCATKCVSWFVLIFNILLTCLGIAILTLGILLQLNVINYIIPVMETKASLHFLPIAIIVVGGTVFIIGILGCISVGKLNVKLLFSYVIILTIIFIVQMCLGVYVLFQIHCETELENNINSQMLDMINHYNSNNTIIQTRIDAIQNKLECCGVVKSDDWNVGSGLLPASCCENDLACRPDAAEVHKHGCGALLLEHFNDIVRITYILTFSVAAIQFLGALFALILVVSLKNDDRRARYQKVRRM